MSSGSWRIMELFGPTIQGEGALCGQATHFIRFGGCGYRCSWCDSMYAVDPQSVKRLGRMMTADDIYGHLNLLPNAPWVTLSGGDPCLHTNMLEFHGGWNWAVETQGQFFPKWLEEANLVTFSPKPPSSGMSFRFGDFQEGISRIGYYAKVVLKVVVEEGNQDDWDFASTLAREFQRVPFYFQPMSPLRVNVPPILREAEIWTSYNWLCNQVLRSDIAGFRKAPTHVLPQLHALAFSDGEATIAQGFRVDLKERI